MQIYANGTKSSGFDLFKNLFSITTAPEIQIFTLNIHSVYIVKILNCDPEPIQVPQEKCLAKKKEKCLKSPPLCKNYNATIYEITIIQALSDLLFLCRI